MIKKSKSLYLQLARIIFTLFLLRRKCCVSMSLVYRLMADGGVYSLPTVLYNSLNQTQTALQAQIVKKSTNAVQLLKLGHPK